MTITPIGETPTPTPVPVESPTPVIKTRDKFASVDIRVSKYYAPSEDIKRKVLNANKDRVVG